MKETTRQQDQGTKGPGEVSGPVDPLWTRAEEIAGFCVRRGAECWRGWPVRTLFAYVFFHVVDRTVFCVRGTTGLQDQGTKGPGVSGQWSVVSGRPISAVLFAWGMPAAEIQRIAREGRAVFQWRRSADKSDALFLAEVIGHRELLPRLVKQAEQRWPDWRRKRVFTFRAGSLVELKREVLEKVLDVAKQKAEIGKAEMGRATV